MQYQDKNKYAGTSLMSVAQHHTGRTRRQLLARVEHLARKTGNQQLRDQARHLTKREVFPNQGASVLSMAKHQTDSAERVQILRNAVEVSRVTGEVAVEQEAKAALADLREELQQEFEAGFTEQRYVDPEDRLNDHVTYTKW